MKQIINDIRWRMLKRWLRNRAVKRAVNMAIWGGVA
jgi:hypothetical protein